MFVVVGVNGEFGIGMLTMMLMRDEEDDGRGLFVY